MPRKKASSRKTRKTRRTYAGRHANGRIKKGYYLACTGGQPRKAKAKAKRKTTRRRKRR